MPLDVTVLDAAGAVVDRVLKQPDGRLQHGV
jgi:hypothetical protein